MATASLVGLGQDRSWMVLLLVATFVGGVGNMLVIVGFMVTATSGLPDSELGMATSLATMTQQIGITLGTPIMSAIVVAQTAGSADPHTLLGGISLAVLINAVLVLVGAVLAAAFLRRRSAEPAPGPAAQSAPVPVLTADPARP